MYVDWSIILSRYYPPPPPFSCLSFPRILSLYTLWQSLFFYTTLCNDYLSFSPSSSVTPLTFSLLWSLCDCDGSGCIHGGTNFLSFSSPSTFSLFFYHQFSNDKVVQIFIYYILHDLLDLVTKHNYRVIYMYMYILTSVELPYITVYKPHFFATEKISKSGVRFIHGTPKKNFLKILKFQFMPLHLALCLAMSPSSVIGVLTHHSQTRTTLKFVCHLGLKVIFLIDLNM